MHQRHHHPSQSTLSCSPVPSTRFRWKLCLVGGTYSHAPRFSNARCVTVMPSLAPSTGSSPPAASGVSTAAAGTVAVFPPAAGHSKLRSLATTMGVAAFAAVACQWLVNIWAAHQEARRKLAAAAPATSGAPAHPANAVAAAPTDDRVRVAVGPRTQFIISTSGRVASAQRYRLLLEEVLGLDAAYVPISSARVDDPRIDPERFAWALRGLNAIGGAISRDIKGTISPFLDEVDPLAAAIGAVNTVVVRQPGSRLVGYNTDAAGFEEAIRRGIEGRGVREAVCYGYGGVTAVVVAVLRRLGIPCRITGRRPDAAAARAAALGVEVFRPGAGGGGGSGALDKGARLFVNAAPVTDAPLEQAVGFLEALKGCAVVFDHELRGKCLREYCAAPAHRGSVHYIPGTEMYYPQMEAQWRLFLHGRVPADVDVGAALREAERRRETLAAHATATAVGAGALAEER